MNCFDPSSYAGQTQVYQVTGKEIFEREGTYQVTALKLLSRHEIVNTVKVWLNLQSQKEALVSKEKALSNLQATPTDVTETLKKVNQQKGLIKFIEAGLSCLTSEYQISKIEKI